MKRVPGGWSPDKVLEVDALCWARKKRCPTPKIPICNAYCVCNIFGYNCEGCEFIPGACGWTRRMMDAEENCSDFHSFTSLSADGKRNSLAEKYCFEEDQVVREDIYELLRDYTVLQFEGDVLTCFMFNNAYFDVSDLTLCDNKQHHPNGVPASNKKSKKQKKTS